MRKKLFILGVVLSLSLTGCGKAGQAPSETVAKKPEISSEKTEQNNAVNTNQTVVTASADYPEYKDAKSLVEASDAILNGKVLSITEQELNVSQEQDAEKLPYLVYEVKIDTVYQGEVSEKVIKIKQLNTGNNMPDIVEGNSYLFLVKQYADSYSSLVNPSQSYYVMDNQQTEEGQNDNKNQTAGEQKISLDDVMEILSCVS